MVRRSPRPYLESLVEKYHDGRNKSALGSIIFDHGYLEINNSTEKVFPNLGKTINELEKKSVKFPLHFYMDDEVSTKKRWHKFIVEEKDVEYVKYLNNAYNRLIAFQTNETLKNKLYPTFNRYLYFLTEKKQRAPKCIYYYKNVNAIGVHYSSDAVFQSWKLQPNALDGHFLPHFRDDPGVCSIFELLNVSKNNFICSRYSSMVALMVLLQN